MPWLSDTRVARQVAEAIRTGECRGGYELSAWIVMPNHVHLLILPRVALPQITHWIKGRTAREANLLLGRVGEPFWQHESYDHWARNERELRRIAAYIEDNGHGQAPQRQAKACPTRPQRHPREKLRPCHAPGGPYVALAEMWAAPPLAQNCRSATSRPVASRRRDPCRLCSCRPRLDHLLDFSLQGLSGGAEVVFELEAEPEFGRGPKVSRQAQGGIGGDSPASTHDVIEACCRDTQCLGELFNAHAQRFENVLAYSFAGMRNWY